MFVPRRVTFAVRFPRGRRPPAAVTATASPAPPVPAIGKITVTSGKLVSVAVQQLPCGRRADVHGEAADRTEQNGNTFGQYMLWGVGMFAKRENDMLVKKGATFHVSTLQAKDVPVIAFGTAPTALNPSLIKHQ
jgi:hypothetical protein